MVRARTAPSPIHPHSLTCSPAQVDWSETHVHGTPLKVPDDIYARGCVSDLDSALASAERIGYPVMIKVLPGAEDGAVLGQPIDVASPFSRAVTSMQASEGGGGKGIRKAVNKDVFPALYRQVPWPTGALRATVLPFYRSTVLPFYRATVLPSGSALTPLACAVDAQVLAEVPGSPVFIMKLASRARHLEVQVCSLTAAALSLLAFSALPPLSSCRLCFDGGGRGRRLPAL